MEKQFVHWVRTVRDVSHKLTVHSTTLPCYVYV